MQIHLPFTNHKKGEQDLENIFVAVMSLDIVIDVIHQNLCSHHD